jgi:KipI family sensor histidine kinase inhibitor
VSGLAVVAYGEGAALVDLDAALAPDRAARTHALAAALLRAWPTADVVVGAGTIAVVGVPADLVRRFTATAPPPADAAPARTHTLSAVYDGPDLEQVAATLGLPAADVIARHAGAAYVAELVGFLPGFAYLSAPPGWALAVPRRPSPRPRVTAGSVGIAASFTGIYPFASPGGWNLIARLSGATVFDPARDPPALLAPGDRVRFVPVTAEEAAVAVPEQRIAAPAPGTRGLLVIAAPACATVQDRGRLGLLGRGMPPSGPLDEEAFLAANLACGNASSAALVEVPLGALEVEARGGPVVIAIDGLPAVRLAEGERFRVSERDRAVRYLAVRGGVEVPLVLGSRSTLPAARLGGYLGRPLRRGDLVPVGDVGDAALVAPVARTDSTGALVVDPGPHLASFPAGAYEALLAGAWQVSRLGDRTGVRLEGARVPREGPDLALPAPMIRGAIEVTADGTPIVLGPDHPTTGGYPVLAVLRASSHAALARLRPGALVRLQAGS